MLSYGGGGGGGSDKCDCSHDDINSESNSERAQAACACTHACVAAREIRVSFAPIRPIAPACSRCCAIQTSPSASSEAKLEFQCRPSRHRNVSIAATASSSPIATHACWFLQRQQPQHRRPPACTAIPMKLPFRVQSPCHSHCSP